MNPELKAKWLEALRSGQYKQGQHVLRNNDGCFCCLGVLADLVSPDDWAHTPEVKEVEIDDEPAEIHCFGYGRTEQNEMLEDSLLNRLGIAGDIAVSLAVMNDEGESFEAIAREIEAKL